MQERIFKPLNLKAVNTIIKNYAVFRYSEIDLKILVKISVQTLVGVITIACVLSPTTASTIVHIAMANATLFPVPVCA